jgi:small GTP-binding protein
MEPFEENESTVTRLLHQIYDVNRERDFVPPSQASLIQYKRGFKFIVIDSSGVGKTSLLKRRIDDQSSGDEVATIGAEYVSKMEEIDGQPIRLQICRLPRKKSSDQLRNLLSEIAIGVVLVYDITERRSFDELSSWLNDVHQFCDPNAVITLIGNKLDLDEKRAVTNSEAQLFATNHHLTYIEASALDGANVTEAFHRAAKTVYDRAESGLLMTKTTIPQSPTPAGTTGGGCC